MRPSLLADLALDIVTHHPLALLGFGLGAALLSWLITRTREPV